MEFGMDSVVEEVAGTNMKSVDSGRVAGAEHVFELLNVVQLALVPEGATANVVSGAPVTAIYRVAADGDSGELTFVGEQYLDHVEAGLREADQSFEARDGGLLVGTLPPSAAISLVMVIAIRIVCLAEQADAEAETV
jgi:hypothetical protein